MISLTIGYMEYLVAGVFKVDCSVEEVMEIAAKRAVRGGQVIGLDTNVLLRYFMQDDIRQSALADSLINSLSRTEQGFVSLVVLAELVWALSYGFQLGRGELHQVLVQLVYMPELKVENAAHVLLALRRFKASSADLADCLIVGIATGAGCSRTATFDRKAAKLPGAFYIA